VEETKKTGVTTHPMLAAIAMAGSINKQAGGALVAPWELDHLPDEWLDAYRVLAGALATQKARQQQQSRTEGYFAAFRQKHPNYHKYTH